MSIEHLLPAGETVVRVSEIDDNCERFNIHYLEGHGFNQGDKVVVEVLTQTSANVQVGGNPLKTKVASGFGHLATKNMHTGETTDTFLEPGVCRDIPADDVAYSVLALSEEPVIYFDYCQDFDPANEITLAEWQNRQQVL